jgi:hypothetical protein
MRVGAMADAILAELETGDTIRKLNVLSHGTFGTALIGENISSSNVGQLSPLRGRFSSPNDGVLFHGCRIASDRMPDFDHDITLDNCSETTSVHFEETLSGVWTTPPTPTPPTMVGQDYRVGLNLPVGYRFMWLAALTMNVAVTAPVDRQFAVPRTIPRADRVIRGVTTVDDSGWEGEYVTVNPDGTTSGQLTGTPFRRVYQTFCRE